MVTCLISQDSLGTLGGMEDALGEVQNRGKRMMMAVIRQKDLLSRLGEELERGRQRTEVVVREVREEERRLEVVEGEREGEERERQRIGKLMLRIADSLDSLEDRKAR